MQFRSEAYRGHAARGRITEFSARSRARLRSAAFDLGEFHAPDLLLTLTYPGQWRAVAGDGPTCRRHLKAFRKRLTRYLVGLGVTEWSALWFREFQRRGAPHFHLLLWGDGLGVLELRQAGRWLSRAWAAVVDHPDAAQRRKHEKAGTRIEAMRTRSFAYAVTYASKPRQKRVPDGFGSPGRWWGLWRASVPAPITFSGTLSLPTLQRLVDRLSASVREHSAQFADALPRRVLGVVGRGWPVSVRVHGRAAAAVALGWDLEAGSGPSPPV